MQQQNVKSATTAGLLGIFLGVLGAHNWYLGKKKKAIIQLCLGLIPIPALFLLMLLLPKDNLSLNERFGNALGYLFFCGIVMLAVYVWTLIESIIILKEGDAGLARKGYIVAKPKN